MVSHWKIMTSSCAPGVPQVWNYDHWKPCQRRNQILGRATPTRFCKHRSLGYPTSISNIEVPSDFRLLGPGFVQGNLYGPNHWFESYVNGKLKRWRSSEWLEGFTTFQHVSFSNAKTPSSIYYFHCSLILLQAIQVSKLSSATAGRFHQNQRRPDLSQETTHCSWRTGMADGYSQHPPTTRITWIFNGKRLLNEKLMIS